MYICVKIESLEHTVRIIETNDWATYLLVLCFVLMALAKYFYPRRFGDFMMLPLNNKFFMVHGKEDTVQHPFNIIFFVVQVICAAIFVNLLISNSLESSQDSFLRFIQVCTAYGIFVLAKFSVEKIVANIFSIDDLIDHYLYQKLGYRNFLSLILFAGILFFLYIVPNHGQAMWFFALAVIALNAIALFFTYKKNTLLIGANFFYFILYLCALEISPYIILYKLFLAETSF